LGVCGGNAALRGGDVRTALNQLRGDAEWNAGQPEIERGGLKSEFAGLLVGKRGDGVFKLGAGLVHVDELGANGLKLGKGLGFDDLGDHAAFQETLRKVQLVLISSDGGLKQAALRVEAAELKVVLGQLGVQAEVEGGKVGCTGLGGLAGRLDGAAN